MLCACARSGASFDAELVGVVVVDEGRDSYRAVLRTPVFPISQPPLPPPLPPPSPPHCLQSLPWECWVWERTVVVFTVAVILATCGLSVPSRTPILSPSPCHVAAVVNQRVQQCSHSPSLHPRPSTCSCPAFARVHVSRGLFLPRFARVLLCRWHGKGRRADVCGSFLVAVYDPDASTWVAVSKLGTGFTDEDLAAMSHGLLTASPLPGKHDRYDVSGKVKPDVWLRTTEVRSLVGCGAAAGHCRARFGACSPACGFWGVVRGGEEGRGVEVV